MERSRAMLFAVLVMILSGCLDDGKSAGSVDTSASTLTEPEVDVPSGALPDGAEILIETDDDPATVELYQETAFLFDAGPSLDEYIRIIVSQQPTQDITVRYPVPQEFLEQLGEIYRPRIFALFVYESDHEGLESFEGLDYQFDGKVLTATLPSAAFFEETEGKFEAIVVVGSSPVERVEPQGFDKMTKTVGDQQAPSNQCKWTTIGSPISRVLAEFSKFGVRYNSEKKKTRRTLRCRSGRRGSNTGSGCQGRGC